MLDENKIMSLTFLSYGGEMSGDHNGMRYMIKRIGEKPDFKLQATVWPEPLCFDKTPDDVKTSKEFEFTQEGRAKAIEWLKRMYDEKKEIWESSPKLILPGNI